MHLMKQYNISYYVHLRYIVLEVAKIGSDFRTELPDLVLGTNALKLYVNAIITEWKRRGYVNSMLFYDLTGVEIIFPEWLGDLDSMATEVNQHRHTPAKSGQLSCSP